MELYYLDKAVNTNPPFSHESYNVLGLKLISDFNIVENC